MIASAFALERPATGSPVGVLVHVPHAGTFIPEDVKNDLLLDDRDLAEELRRITDHATDLLTDGVRELGASRFVNRLSRLVIDPERFTDGTEMMEKVGMGAVYTKTSDGRPLREPDDARRQQLLDDYFWPYTHALAEAVRQLADVHATCTLIDVHSYPAEPLPYELAPVWPRPEICIGTDGFHTPTWLVDIATGACERFSLDWELDVPFAGTYTPTWAYQDDHRVRSIMLEIRRDVYLDESTAEPSKGLDRVREFVGQVVEAAAHSAA